MAQELKRNVKSVAAAYAVGKRTYYKIQGEKGLLLAVYATGRRTWLVRYQTGKGERRKERTQVIGDAEHVGLAEACKRRAEIMAEAGRGGDPRSPKTFGELFRAWLEGHAKKQLATWSDEEKRYRMHLAKPLEACLFAEIQRKDVREIRDNVAAKAGPIQSNRVVALFNRVANWAVDEDHASFNPANRLRKIGQERRRERVLSDDELRRLWAALDEPLAVNHEDGGLSEADLPAALAMRRAIMLLLILGQRRGETIGMTKDELELEGDDPTWTIPPQRTKNGLSHRVPLTATATEILKVAIAASPSPFLFPSSKTGGPIIADAVTKALKRICARVRPKIEGLGAHDLRRTVGTNMRRLGVSVEDRGHVLNHVSGAKSKLASWNYDAGEHDVEKRAALERWEHELRRVVGLDASAVNPTLASRPLVGRAEKTSNDRLNT
jgi:integrase